MNIRLNLIPEYRRAEIEKSRSFGFALKLGLEILVLFLFVEASLVSFQKIADLDLALARKSIDFDDKKKSFDKIAEYDEEFKSSNLYLTELEKIRRDNVSWSLLFRRLDRLVAPEIIFNGLATKNFKIMLSGVADSREKLVAFKETLEKEECFRNVSLPLSNLVSRDNVDFQIEFVVEEKCLKKND